MSSVILGIMGVVLFIGLALAGASYFGEGITDARSQSAAAQIVQSGEQYAAMVALYRLRVHQDLPNALNNANQLINTRILKTPPENPLEPSNHPFTVDAAGAISTNPPGWVLMFLGHTTLARDVCIEIERDAGHLDRIDKAVMETTIPFPSRAAAQPGCQRTTAGYGGGPGGQAGDYLAYFPV